MSEAFYEKFLGFFTQFMFLLFGALVTVEFLTFYVYLQNSVFFYVYDVAVLLTAMYAAKFFLNFREFKSDLYLFFPSNNIEGQQNEFSNAEFTELSLEACRLYRCGFSMPQIEEKLGFTHPTQVRRALNKGLKILLESYGEKHEET